MIKNYFSIGLRNLRKHLTYSIINIGGFSLGLATCILLIGWIAHEVSYDKFHERADQLYRVSLEYSFGGQTSKTSVSPTALLPALQKNFPEIENGVRLFNPSSGRSYTVRYEEKLYAENKFHYADSTFFKIFTFPLLAGNPDKVLTDPNTVVVTTSTAQKYFGHENPIGKILEINRDAHYTVTGVVQDPPSNSLIQFDFIGSFSSLDAARELSWWTANYETYVVMNNVADVGRLTEKTEALVKQELASELTNPGDFVKYNFIRLTDIYLYSDMKESQPVGNIQYVRIFGAITILILLVACINYINLATARATDRAKEVGIRKVIGALRKQLVLQFISESIIVTMLSLCLAFLFTRLVLPLFNNMTGKYLPVDHFINVPFLLVAVATALIIAVIAGGYPAFAIAAFKPVHTLKGNFKTSEKGVWLRKGLVVFQFSISIVLLVGTIVVLQQLSFIQHMRLGYNKDQVVVLPLDSKTREILPQLKTEIIRRGVATVVGCATESPTHIAGGYSINIAGKTGDRGMIVTAMSADIDFIPALSMEIAAGRNFTSGDFERLKKDTACAFVLNESAVKELMLTPAEVIGTRMKMNGRTGEVVGVVRDFHFASLHQQIAPLVLFTEPWQERFSFVKLKGDPQTALKELESIATTLIPHRPFEYTFLDEQYSSLYKNEQRMGMISTSFATLAIVIAGLGLFGLVSFSAAQKTKEIGIRKVLGATVASLIVLITKDFTRLILLAIVIGVPTAYWIMDQWLSSFAYKAEIGMMPVLWSSVVCTIVALGTAGVQALRAALTNPTETLHQD